MGERRAIAVRIDFLHELIVLVEFEQHGSRAAARDAALAGARIDEQVALGIGGDAHGFAHGVARNGEPKKFDVNLKLRIGRFSGGLRSLLLGVAVELRVADCGAGK